MFEGGHNRSTGSDPAPNNDIHPRGLRPGKNQPCRLRPIGSEQKQLPTRSEIADVIRRNGLRRLEKPVRLASGAWSRDFVDVKEALAAWEDLHAACAALTAAVWATGAKFDAVGGLATGANALSVGISAIADGRWFIVRKQPPDPSGADRRIEGAQLGPGIQALVVDDVVTTGGSLLEAIAVVRSTGAEVTAAAAVVDRGESTRSEVEALGLPFVAVCSYLDLDIAPVRAPG